MTPEPVILGLSGRMGSGKTWLARRLHQLYGFYILSFAEQLKSDVLEMGFPAYDVYVDKPPHIRKLLQVYGQAKRAYNPNHWLDVGMAQADRVARLVDDALIVFDDVRFVNEADAIRERNGIILRLHKSRGRGPTDALDTDISETEMDNYPFDGQVCAGNGELDKLLEGAVHNLKRLKVI